MRASAATDATIQRQTSSYARSRATDSWTEGEIAQFEAHHPVGTKPRLALALLLYTAQRRSDVVRMGRQHIRNGALTVKQQKTGTELPPIPVLPELQVVLNATPSEHLTFLVTTTGKPYGPNHFSESFREWVDAAGPFQCSKAGPQIGLKANGSLVPVLSGLGEQLHHNR